MMKNSPTNLDVLVWEHEQLGALFAKMQTTLQKASLKPSELAVCAEELQSHLHEHFEHEEGKGLFAQLRAKAPHMSEEVARLQQEHQSLATTLSTLIRNLSQDDWNDEAQADWRRCFQHFHEAFSEHEDTENRLLQEAYDRDEGAKD